MSEIPGVTYVHNVGLTSAERQDIPSRFEWATVTQVSPLRVRLDGDTAQLPLTPELVAAGGVEVGTRVWCHLYGRRVLVTGIAGTYDTGWVEIDIENTTNFELYSGTAPSRVRRIGQVVYLRGALQTKTGTILNTTALSNDNLIHVLDSEFWPSSPDPIFVCQGSYSNRWAMRVNDTDGSIWAHRYGPDNDATGTFLPYDVSWVI
jgi:hypothetical protein